MLRIRKKKSLFTLLRRRARRSNHTRSALPALCIVLVLLTSSLIGYGIYAEPIARIQDAPRDTAAQQDVPEETEESVADVFNSYGDSLYDETSNTYSFNSSDYESLFGDTTLADDGAGLRSGTFSRGGETWNIYCYSSSNSCSVSTSSGAYGNVYCYEYSNSCSYSDSDGNYANSYCYEYSNSCTTSDSSGGYSNTYCYEYSNSCTTSNSDGSTTNTYCYEYSGSCTSSTYGGYSSYDY